MDPHSSTANPTTTPSEYFPCAHDFSKECNTKSFVYFVAHGGMRFTPDGLSGGDGRLELEGVADETDVMWDWPANVKTRIPTEQAVCETANAAIPPNGMLTFVPRQSGRPAMRGVSVTNAAFVRETGKLTAHLRFLDAPLIGADPGQVDPDSQEPSPRLTDPALTSVPAGVTPGRVVLQLSGCPPDVCGDCAESAAGDRTKVRPICARVMGRSGRCIPPPIGGQPDFLHGPPCE